MKPTNPQSYLRKRIPLPPRREGTALPSLTTGVPDRKSEIKKREFQKRDPKTHKSASSKRNHNILFFTILAVLITGIGILVGITVGTFNQYLDQMPKISYLEDYNPWMPSRMFSAEPNRQLVADFFSDKQNREKVPLADIPDNLINALIAIEDHEFFDHPGISPLGFVRAAYYDIKNRNLRNGGSTITMQLAEDLIKNKHLVEFDLPDDMELKSFQQKFLEILLALQIEKRFTKNEILEFYLNQVFMGGNLYGVATAAEYYFDKEISDLNLKECALFAGMQQRPNAFSPTKNLKSAEMRTELVLKAMLRRGFITEEQFEQARTESFQLNTTGTRRSQIALYPYFSAAVVRQFNEGNIKTFDNNSMDVYGRGIDIESTIHTSMQEAAESALKQGIIQHEHTRHSNYGKHWGEPGYRRANVPGPTSLVVNEEYDAKLLTDYDPQEGGFQATIPNVNGGQGSFWVSVTPNDTWLDEFDLLHKGYYVRVKSFQEGNDIQFKLAKDEYVQGSLIAVRPSTGEILAQVGGYDYYDKKNAGQFIRTIQATTLQPGSVFKPLLYTAALADREKKWTIASILRDDAREYWAGWTPRNFYDEYYGSVTMLYSLTHSLNAATVWLLDNYKSTRSKGIEHFRMFCRDVFELPVEEANLSISLGTTGTTPLEIAQAFSVLANEGNFVGLHMVNKVYQRRDSRRNSNLLYEFKQPEETQSRLSPQVAYLMTYMLRNVVEEGTGKPAKDLPFFSVGKTGTTNECTYAWYAGYTKDLLCVVYMGFDDFKRSLGGKMTGSKVALPIWIDFMKRAYEIQPELFGPIDPPPGIVFHEICASSGKIASSACPSRHRLPFEKGVEPTGECPIHGKDTLRPYRNSSNRLLLTDQRVSDY